MLRELQSEVKEIAGVDFQLPASSQVDVELLPKPPEMDSIPQILCTLTEGGYAQCYQRRRKAQGEPHYGGYRSLKRKSKYELTPPVIAKQDPYCPAVDFPSDSTQEMPFRIGGRKIKAKKQHHFPYAAYMKM